MGAVLGERIGTRHLLSSICPLSPYCPPLAGALRDEATAAPHRQACAPRSTSRRSGCDPPTASPTTRGRARCAAHTETPPRELAPGSTPCLRVSASVRQRCGRGAAAVRQRCGRCAADVRQMCGGGRAVVRRWYGSGTVVVRCWYGGGMVVVRWWYGGGTVVVRW